MNASTSERTLQPAAWRRAVVPIVVAVIVFGVLLQEPLSALFPAGTSRWLVFAVIAVVVVAALVGGLSLAYPRVVRGADGVLRVRGARIAPDEIVSAHRALSGSGAAAYLVYTLRTSAGRGLRILVAGTPILGLGAGELAVLREVIASSRIPVAAAADENLRAFVGQNVLATGRRAEMDRELLLRELDGLRGVTPAAADASAPAGATAAAEVAASAPDAPAGAPQSDAARAEQFARDDADAVRLLAAPTRVTRLVRRVALAVFALACAGAAVLLVVLVVMEAQGTDFGAADEDPLVFAMLVVILAAIATGILWAVAADVDDARRRATSRRWSAEADPELAARGLPTPFHAAWLRAPGGRMAGLGMFVGGMLALVLVIGGPVLLAQEVAPAAVGILVTVLGAALSAVGIWGWYARRTARARRVAWLVEAAGARVTDAASSDGSADR